MSDFIDHLLAQAQPGAAVALAPPAPSRFEPVPVAEEAGSERIAAPDVAVAAAIPAPAIQLSPPRQQTPRRAERPETQEPQLLPHPAPAPAETRVAPLLAEEPDRRAAPVEPAADASAPRDSDQPHASVPSAAESRPYEVQVPIAGEIEAVEPRALVRETLTRETLREVLPAEPAAGAPPPDIAEPVVPAVAAPPLAVLAPVQPRLAPVMAEAAVPPPPAPIVEVRIGRIEIHAAPPASPVAEAAPGPAAAGPSRLDRYLVRA
jgi:hypothetical protein